MRRLSILGSTGSIGKQTLEVVRKAPDDFTVESLTCGGDIDTLYGQILEFRPKVCSVADEQKAKELSERLRGSDTGTEVLAGKEGNITCATLDSCDTVVGAIVGFAGLEPVYHAVLAGKDIALANKETLVAGGDVIMPLIRKKGVMMLPIDSEHSAIWQCLKGEDRADLDRILITASGGPFRGRSREELGNVTVEDALHHPTWNMGGKITIDSATMMNKGLEVIEARWLFDVPADKIDVHVHPESIVHSMVEFMDGSVIAQMGLPDMKIPIGLALDYPSRLDLLPEFSGKNRETDGSLDFFTKGSNLTFEQADRKTFKCLDIAYAAIKEGGSAPVVMNGANEELVAMFLAGKIGFTDIADTIERVMKNSDFGNPKCVDDILTIDKETRVRTRELI